MNIYLIVLTMMKIQYILYLFSLEYNVLLIMVDQLCFVNLTLYH
jgi:hypothetical protein